MKKQSMPLIIFGALVIVLAIGLTLDPKDVPSPLIGKPASEFSLPELYTQEPFSPTQLKGEAWILNIWASWCVSCRQEHEVLVEFSEKYPTKIVGLNYKDTPEEAKAWLKQFGNPYQITVEDQQGRAGIDWGVYGVPETFVIDKKGIIRHKFTGPMTRKRVNDELKPLLAQIDKEPS
ncbi:DsbE family thiol:disulfide interchange protein [Thiomicrorhabdus sp. 6S2-11]|jgi:cytochrome c biogenesis protein CcmG/thiol:disulfide interchange protein DsbE|uniref:DsbE family thiol:disulfide interchange protein n=1 Tax=Thiomicrorhabdus marina TaxID=2818442 RepID=A0ABS3Q3T4_9GAMM|nr:DsbE family thiol:disulfide interchange protein [Thiomicrorhabdus marina]MBO1927000.1 DsbE family thiol:disulfide interchange protein [Thiomicrorhabdus marina]